MPNRHSYHIRPRREMGERGRIHKRPKSSRLELDQKPNLRPGRVQVVLRQESEPKPPKEDWWQYMQRARRELEEAGSHFMNEEEVNAHLAWLREGNRLDDLLQLASPDHQPGEQPRC